jgi:DNA-binding LytR/AlgR family response regulator
VKASSFFCGEDLLASISHGYSFDLIFLDIELKEMNGVELGKIIRSELNNEKIHIAYISVNTQYALELFQVRPLDFLVKPYSEEQIVNTIEKARNLTVSYNERFSFKSGQEYCNCSVTDILYFESRAHKIIIKTSDAAREFYQNLNTIEQESKGKMLRIHKSYLVNPMYITEYRHEEVVICNGDVLPISRKYRSEVRKSIMKEDWV